MPWSKEDNIIQAGKWLRRKIELIENKQTLLNNQVARGTPYIIQAFRGSVFYAEMGDANIGGEKNKSRPVLVLTPNRFNKGSTILVVPLSTKFKRDPVSGLPKYGSHLLLTKAKHPFLTKDSVAKFEDIRSIDVSRLRNVLGNVDKTDMKKAKDNLLFITGY